MPVPTGQAPQVFPRQIDRLGLGHRRRRRLGGPHLLTEVQLRDARAQLTGIEQRLHGIAVAQHHDAEALVGVVHELGQEAAGPAAVSRPSQAAVRVHDQSEGVAQRLAVREAPALEHAGHHSFSSDAMGLHVDDPRRQVFDRRVDAAIADRGAVRGITLEGAVTVHLVRMRAARDELDAIVVHVGVLHVQRLKHVFV